MEVMSTVYTIILWFNKVKKMMLINALTSLNPAGSMKFSLFVYIKKKLGLNVCKL